MSVGLLHRRSMMQASDGGQEGWVLDTGLSNDGKAIVTKDGYALSPYYKVNPGDSITVYFHKIYDVFMAELPNGFISQSEAIDFWNTRGTQRTITLNAATHYINVVLPIGLDCYILNDTTGEYLFQGTINR